MMRHLLALLVVGCSLPLLAAMPRVLDITQPCQDYAIAAPGAAHAAETTQAIQQRLDYLSTLSPTGGRVVIPRGDWFLTAPLVLDQGGVELVGAGQDATTLQAVPGKAAMPLVHVAMTRFFPYLPHQPENWVPLAGLLDNTVPAGRYGIRTYTEYPPGGNHLTVKATKSWAEGTAFQPGDAVKVSANYSQITCVCTAVHTASADTRPLQGTHWTQAWTAKVPANVFFSMNPFADGALDPASGRASNLAGMSAYTVELAYVNNSANTARPVAGVCWGEAPQNKVWALYQSDVDSLRLAYNLTLADGTPVSWQDEVNPRGQSPTAIGLYRVVLQFDFTGHRLQAWLRGPNNPTWVRTLNRDLPVGAHFTPTQKASFIFGGYPNGSPYANRSDFDVPYDYTLCGLRMSAVPRYADADALTLRSGGAPTDAIYFANDPGTMGLLPLTDHGEDLRNTGYLVTQVLGDAAGETGEIGYGILWPGAVLVGRQHLRVSDMTLKPGPHWGAGIVNWQGLDSKFWNLTIRGGFYAIGDLPYGCSYTTDIRNCKLSGAHAAVFTDYSAVCLRHVTIDPCGRYGVLLSGANADCDDVTFANPVTHRTEYYLCHVGQTYGGQLQFTHLTGTAPAGSAYPSGGVFDFTHIYPTLVQMQGCRFANLGLDAALLQMTYSRPMAGTAPKTLAITDVQVTGPRLAALVRTDDPELTGVIDAPPGTYRQWVQWLAPAWNATATYAPGDHVVFGQQLYVARTRQANHPPILTGDTDDWRLVRLGLSLRMPSTGNKP